MTDCSRPSTAPSISLPIQVVVVEDDSNVREAITAILDDENISVEACPLGWQAHACIRKSRPKVVILDVRMPTVDGLQLFYLLRADPATQHIRVIFLTANPKRVYDEVPNHHELGAVVLPKPFDLQELLDLVRTVVAA